MPHAYLLLDGEKRRAAVYLPHRNEAREKSEGKLLAAEDAELVRKLSGLEDVFATELLAEHLAKAARRGPVRTIFTPTGPAEGFATSRDLALRAVGRRRQRPVGRAAVPRGPLRRTPDAAASRSSTSRT